MKKKVTVLGVVSLAVALSLGALSISANEKDNSKSIEDYEISYEENSITYAGEVTPDAVPAFVAGALVGGLVYDAAKAGVNAYTNAYNNAGGHEAVSNSYKAGTQYTTLGPDFVEQEYNYQFGR
ncbi:hypothetical protein [Cytobacillus kochii]|uniref:Uncharacterized protein n=1 Tax=Cytobacillus kochii TaxID=859143 RepID=A0A248TH16_9BACI|nr:hypothetical protein [Cytobacillus kochii]ASV67471.1 hypothetical protein CKF48_09095 [Cytobacillus kochii]